MAVKMNARVKRLIAGIPASKKDQALVLADNVIAMEDKLDETRAKIWGMDVVIPYDNGGGQKGLRDNPAYKSYERLLSSYERTLQQLDAMREPESAPRYGLPAWLA